jgi:hypothetical protein
MTRRDELVSQHEPFGDAYYFGPECVSDRFKDDPARREASGVSGATFKNTLEGFDDLAKQVRISSRVTMSPSAIVSDFGSVWPSELEFRDNYTLSCPVEQDSHGHDATITDTASSEGGSLGYFHVLNGCCVDAA